MSLDQVAERSGIPLAILRAVEREGLLVPRRAGAGVGYTAADVEAASAGLALLETGLPLADVLDLARHHHEAMRAVAGRAVELFDAHVRQPLRAAGTSEPEAAERLVAAFTALLPAATTLVAHHFRRTLITVAHERFEHVAPRLAAAARHDG
ncbi:MAG: MerR family transcriptional regulator [Acidimicrobiales bacterium]